MPAALAAPITISEWVIACGTLAQAKGFDLTAIDRQLMLIVSEVVELHNVYRNRTGLAGRFEEEVRKEAADIVIRIFSFCRGNGVDLERGIIEKHEINQSRPHRHGKDF